MKPNDNEYTVAEVFKGIKEKCFYLLSKWKILMAVGLITAALTIALIWKKQPTYRATMVFVAENTGGSKNGYAAIAAQFGIDIGGGGEGAFAGENLLEVMKSKKLITTVLLSPFNISSGKLLISEYVDTHKEFTSVNKETNKRLDFENFGKTPDRYRDSIVQKITNQIIKQQVKIEKRDKKLNFISLSFDDKNELFAKQFVEILSEKSIQYYTDYRTKKSQKTLNQLNKQCDSLRQLLYGSLNSAAASSDLNVNPLRQVLRSESQKKQVDVQANTAMYSEVLKQYALAKLTLEKETPLIQVIDEPILPLQIVSLGRFVTAFLVAFVAVFIASLILLFTKKQ
ncbi:MAG: hypothetical protein ACOVQE_06435 [Chitinophagaceae bacterium]